MGDMEVSVSDVVGSGVVITTEVGCKVGTELEFNIEE